jgi:hypothetical protein
MTPAERMCLHSAARDLHTEFRGIFRQESIEWLRPDSYDELASTATVIRRLVIGAERFARQRLQALAHAESTAEDNLPAVRFLCVPNAGRSQMALAGSGIWPAGSPPWQPRTAPRPQGAAQHDADGSTAVTSRSGGS